MQLISQLNEASDIPLDKLKATMKKDKRVSAVFSKSPQMDEIDNPVEFVKTIRYYLLNNRNVLDFVKNRWRGSTRLSEWFFKSVRQIRPELLNQSTLNNFAEFTSDLFRDLTTVTNSTFSADAGSSLWAWLSKSPGYRGDFPHQAALEFASLPSVRPAEPVLLYRGLNFDEASMQEVRMLDGTMGLGSGLRFLKAVRQGKRVADVDWDHATMWYRSKEQARKGAFSENSWQQDKQTITGKLAFVISSRIRPEDIIVDTSMLGPKVAHDPPTVVVKKGKYVARIVHKWTPTGEVDPTEVPSTNGEAASVAENLEMFAHVFKPPFPQPDYQEINRGSRAGMAESFKMLIKPETTAKILKSYGILTQYYNEHIKHVTDDDFNELAADDHYTKAVTVAKFLSSWMRSTIPHPTDLDPRYSTKKPLYVRRHDLGAEEAWQGNKSLSIRELIPFVLKPGRATGWDTASRFNELGALSGLPRIDKLHQKAGKVQMEQLSKAVSGFFALIGEEEPSDPAEKAKTLMTLFRTAERNSKMLSDLWEIRDMLDRLKS